MDWLNAILAQQGGEASATGESYLTEMDRLKQQKALMEALRNKAMQGGRQDQMVGGGSNGSFGSRPGILVPGNNMGTVVADLLQTGVGAYGANKADNGMSAMAGRNDEAFRAALEKGGFPQGGAGNFPQALPQQQPVQGEILGGLTPASMPEAGIPLGAMLREPALKKALGANVPFNENDPSGNIFGAPIADTSGFLEKWGVNQQYTGAPDSGEAGAPEMPEPEIAEPDVPAISASIPASGNMEPMLSGREKWMIQTAHDFPKSAASMNSMLQAESNTRRDLENQPLKMALAEMKINQAAALAASRAQTQQERDAILQAQRIELERLRQNGRQNLKATPAPAKPAAPKKGADAAPASSGAFSSTLKTMREMYDGLEKSKGVTSTKNNTVQNVKAYALSTGPGQILSKALGTKDQSMRNTINSSRPLLIRGIAEATGMSAKNIDSNAELKLWLDAASSPSDDVQSSRRALANIEAWVDSKSSKSTAAPATSGKTVVREVKLKDGRTGVEYSDGSRGYK